MQAVTTFAEAAATGASPSLFDALGIDWRLLIIQIIAFVITVWALGKFVYPWLMKSVDQRQADIEAAAKAAHHAQEAASEAQQQTAALLAEARKEAAALVSTAKREASDIATQSEARAKETAENITKSAQEQLAQDVARARQELHNDTLELVALATSKVVGKTHTAKADKNLIVDALQDAAADAKGAR